MKIDVNGVKTACDIVKDSADILQAIINIGNKNDIPSEYMQEVIADMERHQKALKTLEDILRMEKEQ